MTTQNTICSWRFTHAERPRDICGLPAGPDSLCIFHSERPTPNFAKSLEAEVSKPQHWLVGATIKQDLTKVHLTGARLPRASFEGLRLVNVLLDGALLELTISGKPLRDSKICDINLYRTIFTAMNYL